MRVLFATGSPASYMAPPTLSAQQVVCGPDWPDAQDKHGRWVSLKTPAGQYNLAEVAARLPADQQPEVVVCLVDAARRSLPRGLAAFKGPRVLLIADTHHQASPLLGMLRYMTSEPFTRNVVLYDRHHAGIFRSAGVRNLAWFPGLTFPHADDVVQRARRAQRSPRIAFVGQSGAFHPRRARLLRALEQSGLPLVRKSLSQAESAAFYGDCALGFNASLNGDLNLRVFEILASGATLLTDRLAPAAGLDLFLADHRELLAYGSADELAELALATLADPASARAIGDAGARWFDEHFTLAARQAAFRALAFDGVTPPAFPGFDVAPTRVFFSGQTPALLRALVLYEQVQEWHRVEDEVRVAVPARGADDVAALLETLPRVHLTARDPQLAIAGRDDASDAVAPFLWCPEAGPASATFDATMQARGYVRMHPQAPLFRRLERRADDSRRHVVVCTDDPESGGVAQYNHTLMLALVDAGYRITCIQSRADNPLVTVQREAGISHVWIDYHTGAEFARTLTDAGPAEAIFEGDRPDLVIFSNCCPLSQLAAREAARRRALPYLCVEGFVGAYLADTFAAHLPVLARQYAEAKAIVAVSEENRALLLSRFGAPADRTQVIHYGRPERFFAPRNDATRARLRAELGLPEHAVVSLTTARLSGVKGFQHQLKALLQLKASGRAKSLHLVWAGDGELRAKLEDAVAKAGLKDRVHFLGHRWDVADWYDAADLFVLTSHLEGMPLSIMEAMAKGLPVAATAVSGIPEELGDTGCLLPDPTRTPDATSTALARTLERWTANPAERTAAGSRCRTRAETLFREELMVKRTVHLVADYLAASSSPPLTLLQTAS